MPFHFFAHKYVGKLFIMQRSSLGPDNHGIESGNTKFKQLLLLISNRAIQTGLLFLNSYQCNKERQNFIQRTSRERPLERGRGKREVRRPQSKDTFKHLGGPAPAESTRMEGRGGGGKRG